MTNTSQKEVTLILLAAGESQRFQQKATPKKQWLRIGEIPLWLYVANNIAPLYAFRQCLLVLQQEEIFYAKKYQGSLEFAFEFIAGGKSRQDSLQNALNHSTSPYVLVSDVARCLIPKEIFTSILTHPGNEDCLAPCIEVCDTIFSQDLGYLQREKTKLIQTPQLSKTAILKQALKRGEFSDESSAIWHYGGKVGFVRGSQQSQKLTYYNDLTNFILQSPSKRNILGIGNDIHAFQKGNGLIIGGVMIPCEYAFIAHSDGDVCLHAISDAILGAIGAGDIGEWFPDNDPKYKGIDSAILLQQILKFARNVGYAIKQIDITLFAQTPKLSHFKSQIEHNIAKLLEIPEFLVNLKATTTESLGFVGRKEGIYAQALVTLEYFDWQNQNK